ncbi:MULTISPECIES: MFS transporter [Streptosporangium]|uniref:MFS family arabinose efflux permease n=1 Tax=Streptosporangium brasiliense TaxID=47480 RepID=A0ABT9RJW6_9ACTN|nr:MFS transporter [Streptosporangium brasiliense]MDP9869598.1 putative MFS family arabinose efflux permease [Streptosporangium brasiliense]
MSAPAAGTARHAGVSAFSLAVLAGPMSFGIAGPALILDEVAGDLGGPPGSAAWLVTVFGWGIAVGTPLMSGLVGHRGMRATVTVCALLALAGAGLVLLAPDLPVLLLTGAAQALGAAGLTAIAMQLADSPRRMGVATASLAVVGSVSPLAGSLISDLLSWRAVLALPVVAVLAVPAVSRQTVSRQAVRSAPSPGRFDVIGVVVLTGLVTALVSVPHQPVAAGLCAVAAAAAPGLLLAQAAASIAAASGQGVLAVRAVSAAPEEHRPAAIGLFNLCYLLGTAFGPAVVALPAG